MKKIVLFNTNMEWGGSEKWHLKVADFLQEQDYAVELVCRPHSKLSHEAKQMGFKTREINVSSLSFLNPLKQNELEIHLRQAYALIMNLPQDFKVGAPLAEKLKIKRIIYRKEKPFPVKDKSINKKLFSKLTHVIATSQEVAKSLTLHTEDWFPKDKIHVIPNGIETEKMQFSKEVFHPRKEGEVLLGNAGRFLPEKGHKDLLQVAKILEEKNFKFHLLLAGYGEMENELKDLTAKFGIKENVSFLGHLTNMPKFFNSIDHFIFTSRVEGSSNTLIEAMAYKKTCFAFDVSSIPELIDYTCGYLSPLGDIADMAYKIIHHSPNQMGENALKAVKEKYNHQKNMQKLLNILK